MATEFLVLSIIGLVVYSIMLMGMPKNHERSLPEHLFPIACIFYGIYTGIKGYYLPMSIMIVSFLIAVFTYFDDRSNKK